MDGSAAAQRLPARPRRRRAYGLFYSGEQIRAIAWHEGGAVYWIQNTLTNSVPVRAMLAMAEQTVPVISTPGVAAPVAAAGPAVFKVPAPAAAPTSLSSKIGAALGLVGLLIFALLAWLVLTRQRELSALREQVALALALEASQRPRLSAAGLAPIEPALAAPTFPAPAAQPAAGPTIYRARRRPKRGLLIGTILALVAILAAVGIYALRSSSPSSQGTSGYSIPVAVFNASTSPGAAHRISGRLERDRVRIGEVGSIHTNLGPGTYVLYPPRAQAEARRVADLIPSMSPTVTPIQPQVQSVIGRENEIVIVLD